MGLTIHYRLASAAAGTGVTDKNRARQLVERLRQRACDLPFAEVGPLVELSGDACDEQQHQQDDLHRWLLIQAGRYVEVDGRHYQVAPAQLVAFDTQPGAGCEPANFGLCRYPLSIEIEDPDRPYSKRRLRTKLRGWSWSSFCKTQYASNPQCGGLEHFLRCHLSVIRLLDHARELGLLEDVSDEAGYWEQRDLEALARAVGQWNERIAGIFGKIKDALGEQVGGEIAKFPDFEQLEARAQKR